MPTAPAIDAIYPLSPMQQGLLFHSLHTPAVGLSLDQHVYTCRGTLDVALFERAWQTAVDRHAVLRTMFVWEQVDRMLQGVCRHATVSIDRHDWRDVAPADRDARFHAFLAKDRQRGFDVMRPPLLRLALMRWDADSWRFVCTFHHVLFDGWSFALLLKEVASHYDAARRGEQLNFPPPRPYRDFIVWLQRQDRDRAAAYWRQILDGFTSPTPLPLAHARAEISTRFAARRVALAPATAAALHAMAARERLTLNTIVQGAWALLLHQYTGESDVVFGATVSGRPATLPGVERMIGLFINTLAVRVRIPGGGTCGPWLRQLQQAQAEAREYDYVSLVDVQGWSAVPRGQPLFESLVVFENYATDAFEESYGDWRGLDIDVELARTHDLSAYPLTLAVAARRHLTALLSYDRSRLNDRDAIRLLDSLVRLLTDMAATADRPVAELSVLTDAERRLLLDEWSGAANAPAPGATSVIELIAAQSVRAPDAIALSFGPQQLTYATLDDRARQAAAWLASLGVGPEVAVAICVERGLDMIVGILGILKAGAAYVPMDPSHPPDRLAYMLDQVQAPVILTQAHLRGGLPATSALVVCLDTEWDDISQATGSDTVVTPAIALDQLAYVLYTSGSTGQPKGTMVTHRALAQSTHARFARYQHPVARFLLLPSFAFDSSVAGIFWTLSTGGTLVIVDEGAQRDPRQMLATIDEMRITHMACIPSWYGTLLAGAAGDSLGSLELVIVAGEPLAAAVIASHIRTAPRAALYNEYGPTECTVWSTAARCAVADDVSIGTPAPGTRAYAVDGTGSPAPTDVPGELWIGGDGVARGYCRRPDWTAERFIPDPFGTTPGARLYRTGDRVRWQQDGRLSFVGRRDHQVKLAGHRIELGEIEAILRGHAAVRDCVVTVRDDRLVAYIAAHTGEMTPETLRAAAAAALPAYMVPATWVLLDSLPLTPNGKVDRQRLPAPKHEAGAPADGAPRTAVEDLCAGIWAHVLHLARVGRQDQFFTLGGHSLLATQIVSRVQRALGIDVPLRLLFDAPVLADFAASVEALRRGSPSAIPPLEPLPRPVHPPLSYAQQRLWFLDQLAPAQSVYNVNAAVQIDGPLDTRALRRSLRAVVQRHETLRTTFAEEAGEPVQVIADRAALDVPLADLGVAAQDSGTIRRLARDQAHRPFDLSRGPLLRVLLLRLDGSRHVLLLTLHHVVCDGWSVNVLVREVAATYDAWTQGHAAPLPPLPIQYADYALWQRRWLAGTVLDKQLEYWRTQLAGLAPLELPADMARPAVPSYLGGRIDLPLDHELILQLRAFCHQEGVTPFMVLLATFQLLLGRYTGRTDVAVGTDVANRTRPEIEPLIGFFVNQLVLRARLEGRFTDLLTGVRDVVLDASAHQEVPFEQVVQAVAPERHLSRAPLFQAKLVFQNAPRTHATTCGLELTELETDAPRIEFDLILVAGETERGISGTMYFSTDLFHRETIERMVRHYQHLLARVIDDPRQFAAHVDMLTPAERHQLLAAWHGRDGEPQPDRLLHAIVEQQVARTPDAAAVISDGTNHLTYDALNRQANQLAHRLREAGVGPDVRVALCVDREPAMLVGLLGILKAGGAYVPLDPTYPAQRLAFMLDDASVPMIITQQRFRDALPAQTAQVIALDDEWDEIAARPDDNRDAPVTGQNLAYVIYTSGSTGQPKGVMIAHRNAQRALATRFSFYAPAVEALLLLPSFGFDSSVAAIFWTLGQGGRLVLPPGSVSGDAAALVRAMADHATSHVIATPALYARTLDEAAPGTLAAIRVVVVAGDTCPPALVAKHYAELPRAILCNEYGPTEATIWSTGHVCTPADAAAERIPIGRPIPQVDAFVLDAHGEPVPAGVPGQLSIGGPGLARGYQQRPDVTAAAFVPHPFSNRPGARLYRTGDRVRWRSDGTLDFLGRTDRQVKLRGYRLELDDVEAALREEAGVDACAVEMREERLVAYVAPRTLSRDTLHAGLHRRLPAFMVPETYVFLPTLPLTTHGKVDRAALAALDLHDEQRAFVAPTTPVEEIVAGIWEQVLHVPRVGRSDSFFELGGHSLLATQMIVRVRNALGIEAPLRWVFESPRLADFAAHLQRARRGDGDGDDRPAPRPVLGTIPRPSRIPLSFAQQRLWFIDQLTPGTAVYNVPAAVRLRGHLDLTALRRTLSALVTRHESLRTRVAVADGSPEQRVVPAERCSAPLAVVDLRAHANADGRIADLLRAAAWLPFDLQTAPLVRASLIPLADDDHVLLVVLHHFVGDGWSMGILLREFGVIYDAFRTDRPHNLPELKCQYSDFALWQRHPACEAAMTRQLEYWRTQLADLPPLELPTDRPRPSVVTYRGADVRLDLGRDLSERVRSFSRQEGVTVFITLLAGVQALLFRYTGQTDFGVSTIIAGRTEQAAEPLIGIFVNQLVLRARVGGSFRDTLARVRATTLDAYEHQDVPFEQVVDALHPERSLSRTPLSQVQLVFEHADGGVLRMPGLEAIPISIETRHTQVDLVFRLTDGPEGFTGTLEYASDLFEADTMVRLCGHYRNLLAQAIDTPDLAITELALLSPSERDYLVTALNSTHVTEPGHARAVLDEFERQARDRADAVAVADGERQVTYAALNRQANQLARVLHAWGVGLEDRVLVLLPRSVDLIAALIATWKAGAAYVPLDATSPAARLSFIAADAGAAVLITRGRLPAVRPSYTGRLLDLDVEQARLAAEPDEPPSVARSPQNLAYVIYTSGSTGRPKGTCIAHDALTNYVRWAVSAYGVGPDTFSVVHTSASFDLAVTSLYPGLVSGARLELLAEDGAIEGLMEAVRRGGQLVKMTPYHLRLLNQLGEERAGLSGPLAFVVGGDVLQYDDLRGWNNATGAVRCFNEYGPTEATVGCTVFEAIRHGDDAAGSVPIGQPIANTQVYVLDRAQAPVPVGVIGEIYIGGRGLARGYLGRADLTAERFVPDSVGPQRGMRLYRTGDRGRVRGDGMLEYLGRSDFQVKLHGYRIEPGEIETVLQAHPDVQACAVLLHRDRLVACIVAPSVDLDALRAYVGDRLPTYMVPAAWIRMTALPLTAHGKLDREALPAPELPTQTGEGGDGEPRSAAEDILAGIWAETLGLPRVGRQDGFFTLGGHSLLATRAIARVRAAFEVDVPLRTIFEAPTVAGFAARLAGASRNDGQTPGRIPRQQTDAPPPLSYPQQRLWFLDQLEPGDAAYNMPMAVRVRGPLDVRALRRSVDAIVRRHDVLRTTFPAPHGHPLPCVAPPGKVPVPLIDLHAAPDAERLARRLAICDGLAPFDLARGPLLRCALLRLVRDEHVLLVTMHHIVSDGWSAVLLVREFAALYGAFCRGDASPLSDLPIQYGDFARWQVESLRGDVLHRHVAYWRRQLAGAQPLLLPTDRPRSRAQGLIAGNLMRSLSATVTRAAHDAARREGVTVFMILCAAFQALMGRHADQEHFLIGSPVANRTRVELEELIGFFINMLVLRADLSRRPTFRELLARVRRTVLDAQEHQDLPFDMLVDELQLPAEGRGQTPLFRVVFAFGHPDVEDVRLPGLQISRFDTDVATARFELAVLVTQVGQELYAAWRYDSHLFDAERIDHLHQQFVALVATALEQPDQRLDLLHLAAEARGGAASASPLWLDTGGERLRPGRRRSVTGPAPESRGTLEEQAEVS